MQKGKKKRENGGTARRIGNFWFSQVRDDKSVPEGRYEVRNGNGNSIARRDEARGSDTRTSRRPTERKSRQTDFILRSFFHVSVRPSAYPTTFTPRFLFLFIFEQPVVEMVVLLAYPFRLKVREGSGTWKRRREHERRKRNRRETNEVRSSWSFLLNRISFVSSLHRNSVSQRETPILFSISRRRGEGVSACRYKWKGRWTSTSFRPNLFSWSNSRLLPIRPGGTFVSHRRLYRANLSYCGALAWFSFLFFYAVSLKNS